MKLLVTGNPKETLLRVFLLLFGGAIGGGVGYLTGDTLAYQLYRKNAELSEEELAEIEYNHAKAKAEMITKNYSYEKNDDGTTKDITISVEKKPNDQYILDKKEGKKVVTNYVEKFKQGKLELPEDIEKGEDYSHITLISDNDFYENVDQFVKISLTYYEDDDVLTDVTNAVITNPESIIGPDALTNFGEDNDDPDISCVRNDQNDALYEISLIHGSYDEIVLGNKKKPTPKKRAPKVVKKVELENDDV